MPLFFVATATTAIYTLSLHDALPIRAYPTAGGAYMVTRDNFGLLPAQVAGVALLTDYVLTRSEEHTSELQSLRHLVCRLLLEKKKYEASLIIMYTLIVLSPVT